MVLNELSLCTSAPDIITARQWMSQLIQTLRQASSAGVNRVLRTSDEINYLEIAPNYPISKWRNDPEVDREERRFFTTLTAKAPFWNDVAEDYKDEFDLSQVWFEKQEAQGLGFALIIDGLAISLNSKQRWNRSLLRIKITRLDEHGELIDEQIDSIHGSSRDHIKQHTIWIRDRIRSTIKDGEELWNRRQELFSNLEFCDSVKKQLENILAGQLELQPVIKTLLILQDYCQNWEGGNFNIEPSILEYSPESTQTLSNSKYRKQREFICPNGETRSFSLHAKLRICNWRIYFYPEKPGKVIIGYVGVHLQTVKYK